MPSPGYRVSGKEVEVHDSGSRHHQLCGGCNLQLIQSHAAPSHGPPARVLPPLFFPAKSLLLPKPCGKKKHPKTTWSSPIHSIRSTWSSSPMAAAPRFKAHLPLQPHFRLLLQSATPASIPVFFQLYWAAIVSLGRCGPVAWSQSSPSSHAGAVARGSCFPVPSSVEFASIPLAQSKATAI